MGEPAIELDPQPTLPAQNRSLSLTKIVALASAVSALVGFGGGFVASSLHPGPAGPAGAQGPQGVAGPAGPQGAPASHRPDDCSVLETPFVRAVNSVLLGARPFPPDLSMMVDCLPSRLP